MLEISKISREIKGQGEKQNKGTSPFLRNNQPVTVDEMVKVEVEVDPYFGAV